MHVLLFHPDEGRGPDCAALLRAAGHTVARHATAEAAWEGFRQQRPRLVVLSDAGADGLALCRRIRQTAGGEAPLVMALVPPDDPEGFAAAIDAEVDDCLSLDAPPGYMQACLALVARRAQQRVRHEAAEAELAARVRQQAAVAALGQQVLAATPLAEVLDYAVQAAAEALGAPFCKVLLGSGEGEMLRLAAGVGWRAGLVGTADVPAGTDSQAGYTMRTDAPVVVEDLRTETRFSGPALLVEHGIVSGVSVILRVAGAAWGILGAHTDEKRAFDQNDVDFLQAVANVLAVAIEREQADAALRESVARARAIVDTTVDGIITIDERGTIETFNAAAERIFGYAPAEVVGRNVRVLMPAPYHEEHDGYVQSYLETGHRKIIGIGREVMGRRRDGTVFPMDLAVSEVDLDGKRIFTGIVRDISARRELEQQILRVSEEERRSIGQDLHDGLGQMLTGIGLITQNLARTMAARHLPEAEEMEEVTALIREADQHARGLARGLIPVDLETSGLVPALERLAANAETLFAGVSCTVEQRGEVRIADNTVATHLYRIAQEAVSNAVKHGRAQHIRVTLAGGAGRLRLRIQDDGVGFPDALDPARSGMGVRIMQHRARVIGAALDISNSLGGGATITCTLNRLGGP